MNNTVEQLQLHLEEQLRLLNFPEYPGTLYEPIRYMLSLGGKRMRPVLVLLSAKMFGADVNDALHPAMGVEVFHNFTLLHDDIMDKAPLRRGNPTVHEKWNSNVAILSGDAMFVKSCQLMMMAPPSVIPAVMQLFLTTALEVCEGQQMDMDFESLSRVSIEEYLEMIRLKTAVLVGGSLGIGAVIAGASSADVQHMYDFGVNLGVAFQLQDDILDVYGDADKFGKQVGGDILSNKKTFLLLTAMQLADGSDAEELNGWLDYNGNDYTKKVSAVTALYNRLGVRAAAEAKMEALYAEALSHLNALPLSADQTAPLRELSAMLMAREN